MRYKIIKNKEMPPRRNDRGKSGGRPTETWKHDYPLDELEVGDAFIVGEWSHESQKKFQRVAATTHTSKEETREFATRRMHIGGETFLVCWRIK